MKQIYDFNPNLPSLALGGGGTFGMGAEAGYMDEFKERGANFKDAQIIGTSAGSWVGGFVETEKTFDEITSKVNKVKVPNWKPGYLKEISREIFNDERAANVSAMAVRIPSRGDRGGMEMLNGGEHDLASIVAASSSVPGLFFPARVDGKLYFDGGVRSMGSANLAPKSHKLLAIAALGGTLGEHIRMPIGPLRRVIGPGLERWFQYEIEQWQRQHGGEAVFIRPNRAINELVQHPMDCFSVEVGKHAYELARLNAAELIDRREDVARLIEEVRSSRSF